MDIDRLEVEFRPADAPEAERGEWDRMVLDDGELRQLGIYAINLDGIVEATVYQALMNKCSRFLAPCFRDDEAITVKVELRWPGQDPYVVKIAYESNLNVEALH